MEFFSYHVMPVIVFDTAKIYNMYNACFVFKLSRYIMLRLFDDHMEIFDIRRIILHNSAYASA